MPRPEINNYIFYKIVCDDYPEFLYIGSTANINKRKRGHKYCCNNENDKRYNSKLYETIRKYGGWDNWKMIIIDEAKELTLTQSRIKEENLRKEYNANLNSIQAFSKDLDKAKNTVKIYGQKYREINADKIKEYKTEKIVCKCGCNISRQCFSKHIKTKKHLDLIK